MKIIKQVLLVVEMVCIALAVITVWCSVIFLGYDGEDGAERDGKGL